MRAKQTEHPSVTQGDDDYDDGADCQCQCHFSVPISTSLSSDWKKCVVSKNCPKCTLCQCLSINLLKKLKSQPFLHGLWCLCECVCVCMFVNVSVCRFLIGAPKTTIIRFHFADRPTETEHKHNHVVLIVLYNTTLSVVVGLLWSIVIKRP